MSQFTPLPLDQQGRKLSEFLPVGKAWDSALDQESNLGKLLQVFGAQLYRLEVSIELLSKELDIEQTDQLIREWEISVGIPDSCFDSSGDLETRRKQVLLKLRNVRFQTAEDFENLALSFGVVATVTSRYERATFPLLFPLLFFSSGKAARFTMIVELESRREIFPLRFPIQFSAGVNGLIECLFNKLKPANVQILFNYNNEPAPIPTPNPPGGVAGVRLWLDADDADTIVAEAGAVIAWNDKSGYSNDVTPPDAEHRPVTGAGTINGKNVIVFDESTLDRETLAFGINQPSIVFIVFKTSIPLVTGTQYLLDNGRGARNTSTAIGAGALIINAGVSLLSPAVDFTNPALFRAKFNGAQSSIAYNSQLLISGEAGPYEMIGLTLGRQHDAANGYFDGQIAEVCIYDRPLDDPEIAEVESYLINKWAITQPPPPNPIIIPDLKLWLDADDAATVFTDAANNVLAWDDRSGLNNNVTQPNGDNRPANEAQMINGKNVIVFDGANDSLFKAGLNGGVLDQPNTLFIVFKTASASISKYEYLFDSGPVNFRNSLTVNSLERWSMSARQTLLGPLFINFDRPILFRCEFNTTQSKLFLNKVQSGVTGTVGPDVMSALSLAAPSQGDGANFTGAIAEVIIYNRLLTQAEIGPIENHLFEKWGLV